MRCGLAGVVGAVIICFGIDCMAQTAEERLARVEQELSSLKQKDSLGRNDVRLGGYGELHYNDLSGSGEASDKEEIDFHRFVIFMAYDFSDKVHFNSEVEVEHSLAGDGEPGEVELEQAYVDFDIAESHAVRGGLFLLPVGILNETHEPTTFYGVERNAVEKDIIPTTWWEAGLGLHGQLRDDLSYGAYVHSGLATSLEDSYAPRSGRQKAAEAAASDLAATVALEWSVPGSAVGCAVQYQEDITQGADPDAGSAVLGEVHADVRKGRFGLKALYAEWSLDGGGPESIGADRQFGWYLEPSVKLHDTTGIFARYSQWDNKAGSSEGDSGKVQYDIGVNWWPHEHVVVKADHQWQDNEGGSDQKGFNLGLGYAF